VPPLGPFFYSLTKDEARRIAANIAKPDLYARHAEATDVRVAESALWLSRQARSAWSFAVEARPFGEKW
jgi:hypothetical protein